VRDAGRMLLIRSSLQHGTWSIGCAAQHAQLAS